MRAPTAMELPRRSRRAVQAAGEFLADPPLAAVGAHSRSARTASERCFVERRDLPLELRDDIQFIASTGAAVSAGYFTMSAPRARRSRLAANGRWAARAAARYSLIRATFKRHSRDQPEQLTADARAQSVEPGDWMPGIPRHALKVRPTTGLAVVGGSTSSRQARGCARRQNNQDANARVRVTPSSTSTRQRVARLRDIPAGDNLRQRYANVGGSAQLFRAGRHVSGTARPPAFSTGAARRVDRLRYEWL